jgi:hypothetical protein
LRAAADTTTSRETLVGSVERVTFHNEENGFAGSQKNQFAFSFFGLG